LKSKVGFFSAKLGQVVIDPRSTSREIGLKTANINVKTQFIEIGYSRGGYTSKTAKISVSLEL